MQILEVINLNTTLELSLENASQFNSKVWMRILLCRQKYTETRSHEVSVWI